MTSSRTEHLVGSFAAAIRGQLSDLPPEELIELTEGLDADLTERYTETGELGDPVAYAAELRAAAGIPEPEPLPEPGSRAPLRERIPAALRRLNTRVRGTAGGSATLDFLLALRPVWWLVRAWALFQLTAVFGVNIAYSLPANGFSTVLLIALTLLSVQWGRGRWSGGARLRLLPAIASVLAVLVLPFALPVAQTAVNNARYFDQAQAETAAIEPRAGLWAPSDELGNVFAFDCAGNPLDGVQLFDQNGKPLALSANGDETHTYMGPDAELRTVGPSLATGEHPAWNVFPLAQLDPELAYAGATGAGVDRAAAAIAPEPPFRRAGALTGVSADCPAEAEEPAAGAEGAGDAPDAPDAEGTEEQAGAPAEG